MLNDIIQDFDNELKIMYGDESFFRSETTVTHTWGDVKDRKVIEVASHRGTVAAIGAVDPIRGDHFEMITEGADSEIFNVFLGQLSDKYSKENILLILDNASFHKTQGSETYPLPDNISILYLPPYSPDLNPQENVWKTVKESEFKNVLCRDKDELFTLVIKAFNKYRNHKFKFDYGLTKY